MSATNTTAREYAKGVSKRDALAAALDWALAYEGNSGRPLAALIDAGDVDWNYEQIPAETVAAAFALDAALEQHDRHTARTDARRMLAREARG